MEVKTRCKTGPKGPWRLKTEQVQRLRKALADFIEKWAKEFGCGSNTIRRVIFPGYGKPRGDEE